MLVINPPVCLYSGHKLIPHHTMLLNLASLLWYIPIEAQTVKSTPSLIPVIKQDCGLYLLVLVARFKKLCIFGVDVFELCLITRDHSFHVVLEKNVLPVLVWTHYYQQCIVPIVVFYGHVGGEVSHDRHSRVFILLIDLSKLIPIDIPTLGPWSLS